MRSAANPTCVRGLTWQVLSVVLATGFVCPVDAQTPDRNNVDDDALPEIIVKAQRRSRPLNDVPIAVTVFDEYQIEERKLPNIAGVARYTPNVEWDQTFLGAGNFSAIYIRGIGQAGNFFESSADPAVGVYIDGVYIGRAVGSVLGIHDVAQIEVLRGPQGTLFGRNTTGGAVTVVSARPTEEFAGWADVTTGSDDRLDIRAVLNLPISDQLLARVSAASLGQDGYGRSLQDGTEFGDVDVDSARAALRWLPGDDLTVDFVVDGSKTRQEAPVLTLNYADVAPTSLTGAYNFFVAPTNSVPGFGDGVPWDDRFLTPDSFSNYATGETLTDVDTLGLTGIVEWHLDSMTFKSITAYRDLDSAWGSDTDLSPMTIVESTIRTEQDQFTQEFTLQGLAGRLDWLAGLYYFEEEASGNDTILIIPEVAEVPEDPVFGVPNPLFGVPLSNDSAIRDESAESLAVFAHAQFEFSERWAGFLGLRYTSEDKTAVSASGIVLNGSTTESFEDWSPTLGVQYFIDPGLHLYGSVSQGFKSGGFNTIVLAPRDDFLAFEPEEVTAYEVGLKMSRHRLNLAAAVFFNDYQDIQFPVFNDVTPEFRNAAEAEMKGAELEIASSPIDSLSWQLGMSYLDAKYTRLDDDDLAGLVAPITLDHKLPNAPEWTFNAGLNWSTDIRAAGRLELLGTYSWHDEMYKDAINTPEVKQDAYGVLYAAAVFTSSNRQWQVTLFGDNLTDEEYILGAGSNKPDFGLAWATYARPRTWGLSLRYSFGELID
jgi:iron complex outermembrane receptor protein